MSKPKKQAQHEATSPVASMSLVTDRLRLLATRRAEMWWDIGQVLDEVATRMLSQNLGYPDYTAYGEQVLGIEASEARRLRRVAHHFSREVALRFGVDKLDLLLGYLDASPETHWAIDPLRVEVCCPGGGNAAGRVTFSEASLDELRRATRSTQLPSTATETQFPRDVASVRDRVANAMVSALGGDAPRVKVHRDVGRPEEFSLAVVGLNPENMVAVGQILVDLGKTLVHVAEGPEQVDAQRKTGKARVRTGAARGKAKAESKSPNKGAAGRTNAGAKAKAGASRKGSTGISG